MFFDCFKVSWFCVKYVTKLKQRCYSKMNSRTKNEFSIHFYDIIGFDFDHTICKYKLKPLFNLIYSSLAQFLVTNYSYPNCLLSTQLEPEDCHFMQKGIILDKGRGNFLKLDANYKIIRAHHGTKLLSHEDITKIYGEEHIWEITRTIPSIFCSDSYLHEPFYVFCDYFVTPGAFLCARIVDILDKDNGCHLSSYCFFEPFVSAVRSIYDIKNFKLGGQFFKAIKENPERYVEPCSPELKKWLRYLSGHKTTFLCTSANFDIIGFLCSFCIGQDWKNYFTFISTYAQKPGFFWKSDQFCKVLNEELQECSVHDLKPNTIYSHGNWRDLKYVMQNKSSLKTPNVVYVGDSLIHDVYAPQILVGCDTIAVVEELQTNYEPVSSECEFLRSKHWGSFFKGDSGCTTSLWASLLHHHSSLVIPNLNVLSESFAIGNLSSFNLITDGIYYPRKPL